MDHSAPPIVVAEVIGPQRDNFWHTGHGGKIVWGCSLSTVRRPPYRGTEVCIAYRRVACIPDLMILD